MRHTPGPWKYEGPASVGGPCIFATVKGRRWVVASCTSARIWIGPPKEFESVEPEACANARLIAAAPELLDILKRIMAGFEAGVFVRDITHDSEPDWAMKLLPSMQLLGKAQAAIAKAEGR